VDPSNSLRHLDGLFLLEIERQGHLISPVGPEEILQAGDVLLFTGDVGKFQALNPVRGLEVFGTRSDTLLNANLVEVIVASTSELAQKTLREVDFRTMFDAGVVGIRRRCCWRWARTSRSTAIWIAIFICWGIRL
jgi:Trk K+ transport system NAD-binding subunit